MARADDDDDNAARAGKKSGEAAAPDEASGWQRRNWDQGGAGSLCLAVCPACDAGTGGSRARVEGAGRRKRRGKCIQSTGLTGLDSNALESHDQHLHGDELPHAARSKQPLGGSSRLEPARAGAGRSRRARHRPRAFGSILVGRLPTPRREAAGAQASRLHAVHANLAAVEVGVDPIGCPGGGAGGCCCGCHASRVVCHGCARRRIPAEPAGGEAAFSSTSPARCPRTAAACGSEPNPRGFDPTGSTCFASAPGPPARVRPAGSWCSPR